MVLGQYYRVAKRKFDSYAKAARPYTQPFAKKVATHYLNNKVSKWIGKRQQIGTPYGPSTHHGAMKNTYIKKKLSRKGAKKRKQFKKFSKKVQRVLIGKLSMCSYQESYDSTAPYSIEIQGSSGGLGLGSLQAGYQLVLGHSSIYGLGHGGGTSGLTPIMQNWLDNNAWALGDSGVAGIGSITLNNKIKFLFTHGEVKFTITNNTGAPLVGVDLLVDAYEFIARKTFDDTGFNDPVETWNNLLLVTPDETVTAGYTAPKIYYKGQTPLDCPGFGAYWTLLNKKRIVIPYNSTEGVNPETTLSMRFDKKFITSPIHETDTDIKKGRTKYMMFIVTPDLTGNSFSGYTTSQAIMRIYANKMYHYKVIPTADTIESRSSRPRMDKVQYVSPAYNSTGI